MMPSINIDGKDVIKNRLTLWKLWKAEGKDITNFIQSAAELMTRLQTAAWAEARATYSSLPIPLKEKINKTIGGK
jgi:hypothetical protein